LEIGDAKRVKFLSSGSFILIALDAVNDKRPVDKMRRSWLFIQSILPVVRVHISGKVVAEQDPHQRKLCVPRLS
jgi:hypothetical protein